MVYILTFLEKIVKSLEKYVVRRKVVVEGGRKIYEEQTKYNNSNSS